MTRVCGAQVRFATIFIGVAALSLACAGNESAPAGFPGLAIAASCVGGKVEFSEAEERYPGERAFWATSRIRGIDSVVPLPCLERASESYRLRWSSALTPTDTVILITRVQNRITGTISYQWRATSGIVSSNQAELTTNDWQRLSGSLSSFGFWTAPSKPLPKAETSVTLDGAMLFAEGYYQGRYHLIVRNSIDAKLEQLRQVFFDAVRAQKRSEP
jgi:hypothetical protein